MDQFTKLQSLEAQLESLKMTFHSKNLEIAELEEKIQNLKHENLLLTSKVEEMNFNEIEMGEKIKKLQESYESQMDDLSQSKQEMRSKWKDKYKQVGKELDIANERIMEMEGKIEEQETQIEGKDKEIETIQCNSNFIFCRY